MRASPVLIAGLIAVLLTSVARAESIRYRGEYTYGHEVNVFCPAINSQCYWLSRNTSNEIRETLQMLAVQKDNFKPYQPVCVVIEADIDRDMQRDGFASNYDGLITVDKIFGRCEETSIITEGDLQHHRWVLESIDGQAIDVDALDGRIPELDFGEQMHVSGNTGCNRFSGLASLHDQYLRFGQLISTLMSCSPEQNDIERTLQKLLASPEIEVKISSNYLILQDNKVFLRFRLRDWVN